MKNATIAALSLAALTGLTGCDKEFICTDILVWSVALTLVDEGGAPISGATLSVTDGEVTDACSESDDGVYYCGGELGGELTITAEAVGYGADVIEVTVASDECHVITEEITHTLYAVDCTAEVVPSVLVSVTDEGGTPIPESEVSYVLLSDDLGADSIECEGVDGEHWCGEDVPGELEITARAAGYQPGTDTVTVELDEVGCHVVTQELDIALIAE